MLFPQPSGPPPDDAGQPVCSARGCRAHGVWALRWNNPKLHTPDRRKTWLACDDHRTSLSEFLSLRGFLREVVEVGAGPADPPDDGS
ncbi:hypothetical protein [Kineosporia sp. A_224]|uniref:hypothetical protein n=1 Tax=Kineosporia sp. A_224 TaxID=1962180 RepID=UPI000B4BB41D|nr:hypothetical protein [Kineosporia sp. A_224]